jgi:hypothetical protein
MDWALPRWSGWDVQADYDFLDAPATADMLTWQGTGGFSIDASVRIERYDRHGVERLVRYCARPPFALHRLHAMEGIASLSSPEARLLYRLPGPTPDGRSVLLLSPLELLRRLARLVPPPRIHRHRYHGVLAPNARLRPLVIALRGSGSAEASPLTEDEAEPPEATPPSIADPSPSSRESARSSARIRWAQLLARIYDHRINYRWS